MRTRVDTPPLDLVAALCEPATYGISEPVEMHETHASWVFLAGPWAYKVKKPVRLAFLDYSSPPRRRAACWEELRVNTELGGDIYEKVLAIVRAGDGVAFAPEDARGALDYALLMRRFDERRTLAGVLAEGRLDRRDLYAVARRLARFHRSTPRVRGGGAAAVRRSWDANLDELAELGVATADARRFCDAFLAAHRAQIDGRARAGLVRDCHGDLRCEHVLLAAPPRIVDRIEFDAALRRIDVGCDLAFLAMDLERRGAADPARQLLSDYRAAGGDPGSDELIWFYASYWALVRAKVALLAAEQQPGAEHAAEALRLLELAERLRWRARGPLAVIVAGPPASGKSTLARALSERSGFPVLSSDVSRKRLAGLEATQHAGAELYTAGFSAATYTALGRLAADALRAGTGVVIDATCGNARLRTGLLRALGQDPSRLLVVECAVPLPCALERAAARAGTPGAVSDATPDVVTKLFARYEPIGEPAAGDVLRLDGMMPVDLQLQELESAADRQLAASVLFHDTRRLSSAGAGGAAG